MTQAAIDRPTLHPVFAGLITTLTQQPVQLRRADYVARLLRMDWQHDMSDCHGKAMSGRAELAALKALRAELDPDHAIWQRHAPEWMWEAAPVHMLKDFAGDCPVTVEWVHTMHGPRMLAVVVDLARDVKRIDQALAPEVLQRLNQLIWASANKKAAL